MDKSQRCSWEAQEAQEVQGSLCLPWGRYTHESEADSNAECCWVTASFMHRPTRSSKWRWGNVWEMVDLRAFKSFQIDLADLEDPVQNPTAMPLPAETAPLLFQRGQLCLARTLKLPHLEDDLVLESQLSCYLTCYLPSPATSPHLTALQTHSSAPSTGMRIKFDLWGQVYT